MEHKNKKLQFQKRIMILFLICIKKIQLGTIVLFAFGFEKHEIHIVQWIYTFIPKGVLIRYKMSYPGIMFIYRFI